MRSWRIGVGLSCACLLGPAAHAADAPNGAAPADIPAADVLPAAERQRLRFTLDAPGMRVEAGIGLATDGFVLHIPKQHVDPELPFAGILAEHDCLITGDSLRWDRINGCWFAFGHVNVIVGGIHIQADRLGFDGPGQRADLWDLRIALQRPDGLLAEIDVDQLAFHDRELQFTTLAMRSGHGSLLRSHAAGMRVRLHQPGEVNDFRPGIFRHIRDITMEHPVGRIAELPLLWAPILFRDYTLDYPWTRITAGASSRQGYQLGFEIAEDLPTMAGLTLRPYGRVDWRDHSGTGYGAGLMWKQPTLGRGRARWFGVEDEQVYRKGGDTLIQERDSAVIDAEHRGGWSGAYGHVDLSLRYTETPDPDLDAGGVANERFRDDWMSDDLDHEPLGRQGGSALWLGRYGSLMVSTQDPTHESRLDTRRRHQVDASLTPWSLLGPLHLRGDLQVADLERAGQRVERIDGDAGLLGRWWFGPAALSIDGGARLLSYDDLADDPALADDNLAWYPYLSAEVGPVFRADFASGISHVIEPRIGFVINGRSHGDDLPSLDFRDGRDTFDDDQQRLTLALDTSLSGHGRFFSLGVITEWALRRSERSYIDANGNPAVSDHGLARVTGTAKGQLGPHFSLDATAIYDGFLEEYERFDSTIRYQRSAGFLALQTTWTDDEEFANGRWNYQPSFGANLGRYDVGALLELRDGGRTIDRYEITINRNLVDGHLGFSYERFYDDDGDLDGDAFLINYGMRFAAPTISP